MKNIYDKIVKKGNLSIETKEDKYGVDKMVELMLLISTFITCKN